jgi:hypothetical protein
MRRLVAVLALLAAGAGFAVAALDDGEEPRGSTLEVVNEAWHCTAPVTTYGEVPVTVHVVFANAASASATFGDGVYLEDGCTGDGDAGNGCDLILEVDGDGGDLGPAHDGVKVKEGARDLVVCGHADCGRLAPGAHQDAVQVMGGDRIVFRGFRSGDVDARTYTCGGGGGGFFVSATNGSPEDVVCEGCEIVVRNQALNVEESLRSGARDSTFVAETPIRVRDDAVEPVNEGNEGIALGR